MYTITKRFVSGNLKGIEYVENTETIFSIGVVYSGFGSPYEVISIQESKYVVSGLIREAGIEEDLVSPNFVADFASRRGFELTSSDVVEISNCYKLIPREGL
jgi:hypothetical protein